MTKIAFPSFSKVNSELFRQGFCYLAGYAITPKDRPISEHSFARIYTNNGRHIIVFTPVEDNDQAPSDSFTIKQMSHARVAGNTFAWDPESVLIAA